ncbi:MAG: lipoate--protein ligase [Bacteroidetes bacterium]|nr:lipoate--protein ligase [Bacteroidota bacterium]
MKLIHNNNITDATLNLALEEWAVRNLDLENDDYLLFYINRNAIIIGKHQNTIEEINTGYAAENNIQVVRRISGGGAVYHDEGNLNFSFLTKFSQQSIHNFKKFTLPVISTLQSLGVNAELNGRNDITVDGRKISGNAQFSNTKAMFSHGTLLFDSQLENVVEALNVKMDKIESKGIKSIRSRVGNISEFLTEKISVLEFKEKLIKSIFGSAGNYPVYNLSDNEWEAVYELANSKYRNWDWNYGRSPEFNIQKINRFDFGQIDARIFVKDGVIKDIKIYGDFLAHGDTIEIESALKNIKFKKDEIQDALAGADLHHHIGEISIQDFTNFLLS